MRFETDEFYESYEGYDVDESGLEVESNDPDDFCSNCDEHQAYCECDPLRAEFEGGEDSFLDSHMESRMMGDY